MQPARNSLFHILFALAFVAVGTFGIHQTLQPLRLARPGPNATADEIASTIFGIEAGAQVITEAAARLPGDKPILVIGPGNDWKMSEAYYTISYLLWPRNVWSLGITADKGLSPYTFLPREKIDPAGVFLYAAIPPAEWQNRTEHLGERLTLTRLAPNSP